MKRIQGKELGSILLGIWLIAKGVLALLSLSIPYVGVIMDVLAIATGVLILFDLWGKTWATHLGSLLLGICLIVAGLLSLVSLNIPYEDVLLGLFPIATGVLVLYEMIRQRPSRRWGMVLLGIWLILMGLLSFVTVGIPYVGIIMGLLAIVAGVLILLRR